uniref:Uncharacterized protein n=1 Tax=Rhizophora mucronata TaxID=61149 RepID=A0A2P2JWC8_RHIMU
MEIFCSLTLADLFLQDLFDSL